MPLERMVFLRCGDGLMFIAFCPLLLIRTVSKLTKGLSRLVYCTLLVGWCPEIGLNYFIFLKSSRFFSFLEKIRSLLLRGKML